MYIQNSNLPLTPRQTEILRMIRQYTDANGFPPTRAEIARTLGFRSPNAAESHLRALEKKGAVELLPATSRGIRIPQTLTSARAMPSSAATKAVGGGLPVVSGVSEGHTAEHMTEGLLPVSGDLFDPPADYLWQVASGDMPGTYIQEGDLLAMRRTSEPANGQLVLARHEGALIVRRFERHGHWVLLLPEDPDLPPVRVDLRQHAFTIEGVVVGLIRRQGH